MKPSDYVIWLNEQTCSPTCSLVLLVRMACWQAAIMNKTGKHFDSGDISIAEYQTIGKLRKFFDLKQLSGELNKRKGASDGAQEMQNVRCG